MRRDASENMIQVSFTTRMMLLCSESNSVRGSVRDGELGDGRGNVQQVSLTVFGSSTQEHPAPAAKMGLSVGTYKHKFGEERVCCGGERVCLLNAGRRAFPRYARRVRGALGGGQFSAYLRRKNAYYLVPAPGLITNHTPTPSYVTPVRSSS